MATVNTLNPLDNKQTLVYRDFINNSGGLIQVQASQTGHDTLSTYINLGLNRQYTPAYENLNGLYALEIALQTICVRLKVALPDINLLRGIYSHPKYLEAAQQLSGYRGDPRAATPGAINSGQVLWGLTQTPNVSRDALRLVLVFYARYLNTRLRLGVVSGYNSMAGPAWNAIVHDELIVSSVALPNPYTVWIVDDAREDMADPEQALCHWSGLAPNPLYEIPGLQVAPGEPLDGRIDGPAINPQFGTFSSNHSSRRRSRADSLHALESIASPPEEQPQDTALALLREQYPSHLTEAEVLETYPERMTMEFLLYVLRRYKQNELLERLKQKGVEINSEALRQRKKAALDNRAKNRYGIEGAKDHYKDVSREYNEEILRAGWYEPRAERGEKRKRGQDEEEYTQTRPSKKSSSSQPYQFRPRPTFTPAAEGTIDPLDLKVDPTRPPRITRPFYRSNSILSTTSDEENTQVVSRLLIPTQKPSREPLHEPGWAPEGYEPASWPPDIASAQHDDMEIDQSSQSFQMTDHEFTLVMRDHMAVMDIEVPPSSTPTSYAPDLPNTSNVQQPLSGQALSNFFLRAHPHQHGKPDPSAMNGRGAGPPGSNTWFVWPAHREPPQLTLEQIDWYFKDGRDSQISEGQKRQLHEMRKKILDDTWIKNQALDQALIPSGQRLIDFDGAHEVIELSDDE